MIPHSRHLFMVEIGLSSASTVNVKAAPCSAVVQARSEGTVNMVMLLSAPDMIQGKMQSLPMPVCWKHANQQCACSMMTQRTPPSPFAFDGDESAENQGTPPLRSLASRPSFVPSGSSSATTDVPVGSSILWGKGTHIPSSSFHISAAPSAGTTVSNSRPSPRASQVGHMTHDRALASSHVHGQSMSMSDAWHALAGDGL